MKMNRPHLASQGGNESERRLYPMRVRQILQLPSGHTYPICPACKITLEREFQSYCDRCGQYLNWNQFGKAAIIQWTKGWREGKVIEMPIKNDDVEEWQRICDQFALFRSRFS